GRQVRKDGQAVRRRGATGTCAQACDQGQPAQAGQGRGGGRDAGGAAGRHRRATGRSLALRRRRRPRRRARARAGEAARAAGTGRSGPARVVRRRMSQQLVYLLLIFSLPVVPRILQRMKIPAPITALALGIAAMLAWGDRTHDPGVVLLSTLGISSLFLFAGLEVEIQALRRGLGRLLTHLAIRIASMLLVGWLAWRYLDLGWQASALLALALLTPSTGFILDTLERLGLDEEERFWVTSKAIAGGLLALAVLFVALQADVTLHFAAASGAMVALLVGLPLLFMALG